MRSRGAPVGTSVVIGVGRGIMLKHSKPMLSEFGGAVIFMAVWSQFNIKAEGMSSIVTTDLTSLKNCSLIAMKFSNNSEFALLFVKPILLKTLLAHCAFLCLDNGKERY